MKDTPFALTLASFLLILYTMGPAPASPLPNCFHCQAKIQASYHLVGPFERPICGNCRSTYPLCYLCNLPSSRTLKDGRHLCSEHIKKAIHSPGAAQRIFVQAEREAIRAISPRLKLKLPVKEVMMVDRPALEAAMSVHSAAHSGSVPQVLGFTKTVTYTQGNRRWTDPARIYLLSYVPSDRLSMVCLHEYAHAWHVQNHFDYSKTSRAFQEGFAEWVAFKTTKRFGRQNIIKEVLHNQSPLYAEGLQKFLELESEIGVDKLLDFAISEIDI